MPKQKTKKSLAKRVKITKNGKVKRRKSGSGHLLTGKSAKRRRKLRQPEIMEASMAKKFKEAL
mgnify:CR=1 FL=1